MTTKCQSSRRETHGATGTPERTGKAARKARTRIPPMVMIVSDQAIIDALDAKGVERTVVKVDDNTVYENAYLVSNEHATHWCNNCKKKICECDDKYNAPFMLARRRGLPRKDGNRTVTSAQILRRHEMPIDIPKREVA